MTKSAQVHAIDGTYDASRHKERLESENTNNEAVNGTKPVLPQHLDARAVEIWNSKVRLLPWLTEAETEMLALYCSLISEYEKNPPEFPASKMNVVVKLAGDMGMNPIARGKFKHEGPKNKGSKFFND